jgi:hypothetical protein
MDHCGVRKCPLCTQWVCKAWHRCWGSEWRQRSAGSGGCGSREGHAGHDGQVGGEAGLPTALVNAGIAPQDLDRYIEAIAYSDKISQKLVAAGVTEDQLGAEIQKLVVAKSKEIGVTVNPRYGKWDPTTADVIPADSAESAVTPSGK